MVVTWPFRLIAAGVGIGEPLPEGWRSLAEAELLILVGVTGVGKSTTVQALETLAPQIVGLPERRTVTDQCIIPLMWQHDGPDQRLPNRLERLDCTRRFRAQHPGGMGFILSRLAVDPAHADAVLLFDGLRGDQEVSFAMTALPKARFVVMQAPNVVRLQRLLGRNDLFDTLHDNRKVTVKLTDAQPASGDWAGLGVADTDGMFTVEERSRLLKMVQQGEYTTAELRDKLRIVVEEQRNYDPAAAWRVLRTGAPARTIAVDTVQQSPSEIAHVIIRFLYAGRAAAGSAPSGRLVMRPHVKKVV